MVVKQLSVFLENRRGSLNEALAILAENDINIVALSMADSSDFGMLRMMVSDPVKGRAKLKEGNFSAMLTDVICIAVDHAVGSLADALKLLADNGVSVEYMYAFANGDMASAVLKCSEPDKAIQILNDAGTQIFQENEVYLHETK